MSCRVHTKRLCKTQTARGQTWRKHTNSSSSSFLFYFNKKASDWINYTLENFERIHLTAREYVECVWSLVFVISVGFADVFFDLSLFFSRLLFVEVIFRRVVSFWYVVVVAAVSFFTTVRDRDRGCCCCCSYVTAVVSFPNCVRVWWWWWCSGGGGVVVCVEVIVNPVQTDLKLRS